MNVNNELLTKLLFTELSKYYTFTKGKFDRDLFPDKLPHLLTCISENNYIFYIEACDIIFSYLRVSNTFTLCSRIGSSFTEMRSALAKFLYPYSRAQPMNIEDLYLHVRNLSTGVDVPSLSKHFNSQSTETLIIELHSCTITISTTGIITLLSSKLDKKHLEILNDVSDMVASFAIQIDD